MDFRKIQTYIVWYIQRNMPQKMKYKLLIYYLVILSNDVYYVLSLGVVFLINLLIILPMNKIMKNPMKWYKIKSELLFVELRLGVLLENSIKSQSPSGFWNMTAIEKMMAEKTKLIMRCAKPIWNPFLVW